MATRAIRCKEENNWIRFDTINEGIHYLDIEMVAVADKEQMMIHPSLFVNFQKQQQLFDLLKEAGYKVYPGLAGELYAVSWEVGTSWKDN